MGTGIHCSYFSAGLCHSCPLLDLPYAEQVERKAAHLREVLGIALGPRTAENLNWLPPALSAHAGFRNKAKMVVTGTVQNPQLGLSTGQDLSGCPLYPEAIREAFPALKAFITQADLTPYDLTPAAGRVSARDAASRGELKHVLLTASPDGQLMIRFVLRSREGLDRVRKHLPALLAAVPAAAVVSVNLQPLHQAILEGPEEVILTARETLLMLLDMGDGTVLPLHLRPQSFFQTNTEIATDLYRQARGWVDELNPSSLWDLFCGVGGFALACAAPGRETVGIEVSTEAIASAQESASEMGLEQVSFRATDANTVTKVPTAAPEVLIVNPPRRGIGPALCAWIEQAQIPHVIYSSCNVISLAKDLVALPGYVAREARLLDMFPGTEHYEVITLLSRR